MRNADVLLTASFTAIARHTGTKLKVNNSGDGWSLYRCGAWILRRTPIHYSIAAGNQSCKSVRSAPVQKPSQRNGFAVGICPSEKRAITGKPRPHNKTLISGCVAGHNFCVPARYRRQQHPPVLLQSGNAHPAGTRGFKPEDSDPYNPA